MNLENDAMLVQLRIDQWSGRKFDREVSNHVAATHDASTSAGRYNKRLLPKAALQAISAIANSARTQHYKNTLPWDDAGYRLLSIANFDHYEELMGIMRDKLIRERSRFLQEYDENIEQARIDLGSMFRREDYPTREQLQGKFQLRWKIIAVPKAEHFMAKLATDDTDRIKRDIERHMAEQLNGAVGDLYRRLGEAVERVSERLRNDENGKPLVFRDSLIENVRDLVDIVPRLNIFGDPVLAGLCDQVKQKIASVDPETLRPNEKFDPDARRQVKKEADALMEQFAGYFAMPASTDREAA